MRLQIFYKGHDQTLVLIQLGETECAEIGKSVNMMHISAQVALHLQRA